MPASMANLPTKPDSGGKPGEQQGAADEAAAEDGDRGREWRRRSPVVVEIVVLAVAVGFHGDGEHVGAGVAHALDQLDQQEERADRQRRADQVEQRAAPITAPLPVPIAASSVPDETSTLKPASRGRLCEASTPMVPKAIVAMPPTQQPVAAEPGERAGLGAEQQQSTGAGST